MSSGGGESSNSSDAEEEVDGQERPISAVAPRLDVLEEAPIIDVSETPAFQYLDELFSTGKITGTRLAELKAKYTLLHETLKSTQESEIQLLHDAKRYTAELEQQQQVLDKADEFPESFNTEASKLRRQLLKYQNDLDEAEEREYDLQYKLECLEEEKMMLQREYNRIPKAGELEKKAKMLKENCEELHKEITQRKLDIKTLKEDMSAKQKQIQREQKELEEKLELQDNLKNELVQVHAIPGQLGKDMEKINRKKIDLEKKKEELEEQCRELNASLKQIEKKCHKIAVEKQDVIKELEEKRTLLESKEREFNQLTKQLEMAKEDETVAIGERAMLNLNLHHLLMEKKTQHDTMSRKQREKERDLRNLKKMELQLKLAYDSLAQIKSHSEKVKLQIDAVPKDDGTLLERRKELQKEVEMTKRNLSKQQSLTEVEARILEQCIAEEEHLVKEQSNYREEVVNLTRLCLIKADEREQKSRDFLKAEQRHIRSIEDLKTKDLIIQDHKKKNQEVQVRLREFAKMYDIIRNERNKCVSLIQIAAQRAAEMREKIKILDNEIEILRTNALNKDKMLQKYMLKHSNSHMIRDSLRSDVAKVSWSLQEMREKREQQKLEIGRLTNMINQTEEDMVQLRKRYETAVQNRNDRGVQLIEREEEVCIFYEKLNIQETLIRNGDIEMQVLQEEIRFLKMQLLEERRQIDLVRKNLPNKKALDAALVTLQIQRSQCQDKIKSLEKDLEDPEKENRIRLLEGKDPSVTELVKKIEELEIRLAEKEELLLEKDLIYEQVTRLSERIRTKAENGKLDTLTLAKKVNELQKKIKDTTRKMMALISELSMQQASAIKLQQEVRDKEQFLESCYMKMEQGQPPNDDFEYEWLKMLRIEEQRKLEREERTKAKEEEEQHLLPNENYTTAEQRPNAYIPEDETALPIPRPYGALAPFKPSEAGANMRHIRKPIIKPIEI